MKEQIEKIIREAGGILMQHFGKTVNGRDKARKGDVESAADLECERYIVNALQQSFPGDAILTEEHESEYLGGKAMREAGKVRLWVVDALDGSRGFLRGIPGFGISIGLVANDQVAFGMIYLPVSNELFWAQHDQGAFLGDVRIKVVAEQELDYLYCGTIFNASSRRAKDFSEIYKRIDRHGIWRINPGPAVKLMSYTAVGRLDALIINGLSPWDMAAGGLVLREAGAKVTDWQGKPWYWALDPQDMVAANPVLHNKIMKEIIAA